MKIQLLCTFAQKHNLNDTLDIIIECNDILYDKVYVFQNRDDPNHLICTYNVEYDEDFQQQNLDTISLHRKKQSNTLYTINALNEVIRSKNNGILDKQFSVDWLEYQNCLMLTNDSGLNVIPTKIYQVVNVKSYID